MAKPVSAALLSRNARRILEHRYLARDEAGRIVETPDELFRRVAHLAAEVERAYGGDPIEAEEVFFGRMARLELLPNSPALKNAGRESGQLAACFVLPVGDSDEEITDAVRWAALVQVSGGGTGFDFSRLRHAGDRVGTDPGRAAGPLASLEVFNASTEVLRAHSMRCGANMGILRIDHPDIEAFIAVKRDPSRLKNFNLSVAVTDEFMVALAEGGEARLVSPRTREVVRRVSAEGLFEAVVDGAWRTGEPGVLFIDRIDADNPTPRLGRIEATNPCSEQPLLPFEACILGSIDVGKFVRVGKEASVDWERLAGAVRDGVRLLDDLVDACHFPLAQTRAIARANRKVGLGVMGFADLLVRLGMAYDSEPAVETADRLMGFVERAAVEASAELALERGPFANFAGSRWDRPGGRPMRNAALTTVAPTGTLALLAGCSSGIEPIFALASSRRALDGEKLVEVHPLFRAALAARGERATGLAAQVARTGRARGMAEVPRELARLFPTAHDVAPEWHVRIQAAFQRHVHSAVSKTVNFPSSASAADVAPVFRLAYELGCKGITVYRDGSRPEQVLSAGLPEAVCQECGASVVEDGACPVCGGCGPLACP